MKQREIKFRAWDKEKQVMTVSDFCIIPTLPTWSATKYFRPKEFDKSPLKWFDCSVFDWADGNILCGNYVIMQYIGCKDKNGKEIYEGDIVQTNEAGWKAQVVWSRDAFICIGLNGSGFSSECNWEEFEVIGNVYENKDMLIKKEV